MYTFVKIFRFYFLNSGFNNFCFPVRIMNSLLMVEVLNIQENINSLENMIKISKAAKDFIRKPDEHQSTQTSTKHTDIHKQVKNEKPTWYCTEGAFKLVLSESKIRENLIFGII